MRRLALLIPIVAWVVGCGDQPPPAPASATAEAVTVGCESGFSFGDQTAHLGAGRRDRAVAAGPVTLLWLNSMQEVDFTPRRAALVKVLVQPHAERTTVSVAEEDRDRVSLSPQVPTDPLEPPDGHRSVAFEGCAPRVDDSVEGEELGTGYSLALIASGAGCTTFEITPDGGRTIRRRVPLGIEQCRDPLPRETAPMACESGFAYSADKRYFTGDWRRKAVTVGPITLLWLDDYADRSFRRPRALYTKVLLKPHATTTVAVAEQDRGWVRLTTQPPNHSHVAYGGDPAIRFEGCPSREDDTRDHELQGTGYAIALMVDRPGCATFEITPKSGATKRRQVAFGRRDCR